MSACYSATNPMFQPAMRVISAITQAARAVVTTTVDHQYISGEIVRINVPPSVGMQQINGMQGYITVTGSDTFSIDIDTTLFDSFVIPSPAPSAYTCAQVIPIGERNSILTAATENVLPSGDR